MNGFIHFSELTPDHINKTALCFHWSGVTETAFMSTKADYAQAIKNGYTRFRFDDQRATEGAGRD